jgi:hypothetical protein
MITRDRSRVFTWSRGVDDLRGLSAEMLTTDVSENRLVQNTYNYA